MRYAVRTILVYAACVFEERQDCTRADVRV
jgi:hypothetical protein